MKNANKFINGQRYERQAGILMPIFSIPNQYGIGDFGPEAFKFVDFLEQTKQTLWAILPIGQTGYCNSPYKSVSVFAGNPYFISPEILLKKKLVTAKELNELDFGKNRKSIDYGKLFDNRYILLKSAFVRWKQQGNHLSKEFLLFKKENNYWLSEYCLFMSLKEKHNFRPWNEWEEKLCRRDPVELKKYRVKLKDSILFWQFIQYEYFSQWEKLKVYANLKNVRIIGDIPFYVEYDSVDVWSNRQLFEIEEKSGEIINSAGVPGDDFSPYSRNWGMPCYNWKNIALSKYKWHLKKYEKYMQMYDIIRIDHAIGFIRYYGISKDKEMWYDGPDAKRDNLVCKISKLAQKYRCEIIAEDLGSVPERAYYLFNKYNWLGTRVLQFGFANKYTTETIHLPIYYPNKSVAYTGTQDNQTLKEYLNTMDEQFVPYLQYYLQTVKNDKRKLHKKIIEEIYKSASEKVIVPMPDILELDNVARFSHGVNYEKSWKWRLGAFTEITPAKKKWLRKITFAYARTPFSELEGKKYGWTV